MEGKTRADAGGPSKAEVRPAVEAADRSSALVWRHASFELVSDPPACPLAMEVEVRFGGRCDECEFLEVLAGFAWRSASALPLAKILPDPIVAALQSGARFSVRIGNPPDVESWPTALSMSADGFARCSGSRLHESDLFDLLGESAFDALAALAFSSPGLHAPSEPED